MRNLISRQTFLKLCGGALAWPFVHGIAQAGLLRGDLSVLPSAVAPAIRNVLSDLYAGLNLYWGDIHGHTGFSDGYGMPDEYFLNASYDKLLDFAAISDHADTVNLFASRIKMANGDPLRLWERTIEAADLHNRPGEFVTLVGWEWTNNKYGHRNVYFRDTTDVPPVPLSPISHKTPTELWAGLENYAAITIPHHTVRAGDGTVALMDWSYSHEMERLVEIYSKWGNSEFWATDYEPMIYYRNYPENRYIARGHDVYSALNAGLRLGIIAGSDTHQGLAGSTQWDEPRGTSIDGDINYIMSLTGEEFLQWLSAGNTFDFREPRPSGGGIFGVWASSLERTNIWDAMYDRRVFGTTGVRPQIRFAVVDSTATFHALMGEEMFIDTEGPQIVFDVLTEPGMGVKEITLFRNGQVVRTVPGGGASEVGGYYKDTKTVSGTEYCYRLRVTLTQTENTDGDYETYADPYPHLTDVPQLVELVWSSPIWVTRV